MKYSCEQCGKTIDARYFSAWELRIPDLWRKRFRLKDSSFLFCSLQCLIGWLKGQSTVKIGIKSFVGEEKP